MICFQHSSYSFKNICRSDIQKFCQEVNPDIQTKRAIFSAITQKDIHNSFDNLEILNQNKVQAVKARQELDLKVGSVFTRFQTLNMKQYSEEKIISYGPCQIPTLGLIVKRYLEIQQFNSKSLHSLEIVLQNQIKLSWNESSTENKQLVEQIYNQLSKYEDITLQTIETKQKSRQKNYPLCTIDLQKQASTYLKLSSSQLMEIAEKLYNQGYISYPRTETQEFTVPESMLKQLVKLQTNNDAWGANALKILQDFNYPIKGPRNDKAHPPIHPVKTIKEDIYAKESNEYKVYELIVRNFLSCCSKDMIYEEISYEFELQQQIFNFKSSKQIQIGYLEHFTYENFQEKQLHIPLRQHQSYSIKRISITNSKTKPRSLLSESELLSQMDKYGIGTDATMHEHIQKIQTRGYLFIKPKLFCSNHNFIRFKNFYIISKKKQYILIMHIIGMSQRKIIMPWDYHNQLNPYYDQIWNQKLKISLKEKQIKIYSFKITQNKQKFFLNNQLIKKNHLWIQLINFIKIIKCNQIKRVNIKQYQLLINYENKIIIIIQQNFSIFYRSHHNNCNQDEPINVKEQHIHDKVNFEQKLQTSFVNDQINITFDISPLTVVQGKRKQISELMTVKLNEDQKNESNNQNQNELSQQKSDQININQIDICKKKREKIKLNKKEVSKKLIISECDDLSQEETKNKKSGKTNIDKDESQKNKKKKSIIKNDENEFIA